MNCRSCGQALDEASRFCKFCGSQVPPDPDEAAAPIRVGDVLEGKWRIEKKVGQGGMGSVYVAQDTSLDRAVAIKVLAPDLCNDHEFVSRFEREAKATANLEHPNVVLVYSVGQHFGRPFIVMKYLEGHSLARHLKAAKNGLPFEEVLSIFKQVCAGMGFIHQKGFVHRDVKSGNIFIGPDGKATILDLGIVRDTRSGQNLTRVGVVMGTPHYLAPEQAMGKPIDHRADLYALGVLLYECLVGAPPFEADTARRLIQMHLQQPPPDPCRKLQDLPPAVGRMVRKSLAKNADKRFQSADEMAHALEEAFAEQPEPEPEPQPEPEPEEEEVDRERATRVRASAARPTPPLGVAAQSRDTLKKSPSTDDAPKRSFVFPLVVLLGLAAAGGVSWNLIRKEQQEASTAPQPSKPLEEEPGDTPPNKPDKPAPDKAPAKPRDDTPQGQAQALLDEGLAFAKDKHFDYAIGKYTQAEELDAKSKALMLAMGAAYLGVGEGDSGLKYFQKALALDPASAEGHVGAVRSYVKLKKNAEAVRALRAAVDAGVKDFSLFEAAEDLAAFRREPAYYEARRIAGGGAAPVPVHPHPGASDKPDEPTRPDVAVMGMTGELKVVTTAAEPGPASVAIDGKARGKTPLSVELNAGKHTVVVIKSHCKPFKTEVTVPLAGTFTLNATLDPE